MKMNQKGYTLLELLISIAVVLFVASLFFVPWDAEAQVAPGNKFTYNCVDTRDGFEFSFKSDKQQLITSSESTGDVYLVTLESQPYFILISEYQFRDFYRCLIYPEGV